MLQHSGNLNDRSVLTNVLCIGIKRQPADPTITQRSFVGLRARLGFDEMISAWTAALRYSSTLCVGSPPNPCRAAW